MAQRTLSFLARYDVPPEVLWEVVTDHEGMSRWLGVPVRVVAGPAEGGVGTVRRISAGPLALDEEVVVHEPPHRMVYRVVRGAPMLRYHRAEMQVGAWGGEQSQLEWNIVLDSRFPGVAAAVAGVLGPRINRGLRSLARVLDEG